MAVIPFDPLLFGNAANNGRMLGEMDATNPIVAADQRDRACADRPQRDQGKKKAGFGSLLGKLKLKKK